MYKKEIFIIRHARSEHNTGSTQSLDSNITSWGEIQARALGQYLSSTFDLNDFTFYTSPFLRCLQTAALLPFGAFNVSTKIREYVNHDLVTGNYIHIPRRQEHFNINFNWDEFFGDDYRKETNEQLIDRLYEFYYSLPERSFVITHGLPALVLSNIATSNSHTIPVWDYSLDNCSITRIVNGRFIWRGKNLHYENLLPK